MGYKKRKNRDYEDSNNKKSKYEEIDDRELILRELGIKEKLNKREIERLNEMIKMMKKKKITLKKIINADINDDERMEIIEEMLILNEMDLISNQYMELEREINIKLLNHNERLNEDEKEKLEELQEMSKDNRIRIKKILNADIDDDKKLKLIKKYQELNNYSKITETYNDKEKQINRIINGNNKDYDKLIKRLNEKEFDIKIKEKIKKEIEKIKLINRNSEEYYKQMSWINLALNIPTKIKKYPINNIDKMDEFSNKIRNDLNKYCYGMDDAKEMIIDYIINTIKTPDSIFPIITLHGPKGVGKTNLATALSKCLDLPIIKISLGGSTDSSKLIGHSRTYLGAVPGQIIENLVKTKFSNPIIYLDEIDKVCSRHGNYSEINGILTHLLDPLQHTEFIDEYLGFGVDLSKALWIVTANDPSLIDPIVRDRLYLIEVKKYNKDQKIQIALNHLIPNIKTNLSITNEINIDIEALSYLISIIEQESGVRQLKHNLEFLYSRLNRLRLTNSPFNLDNNPIIIDNNFIITKKIIEHFIKISYEHDITDRYFL